MFQYQQWRMSNTNSNFINPHFSPLSISYKNQSFELQCKTNDQFLYEIQHWTETG